MYDYLVGCSFDECLAVAKGGAMPFCYWYDEEEPQYSSISISCSPYGMCADCYDFDFDEKGICIAVIFDGGYEEDMGDDL